MRYAMYPESHAAHEASLRPAVPQPEPYPAPEVTSRDEPPEGVLTPSAVLKVAERLNEAGFRTCVAYARGCLPHATTGKAGFVRDSWQLAAVRGDRQGAAIYRQGWDFLYLGSVKIKRVTEWLERLIDEDRVP